MMRIPSHTILAEPIMLPCASGAKQNIKIEIGAGSQVRIIDCLRGAVHSVDRTIEIILHAHASLTFLHEQAWDEGVVDTTRISFTLHKASSLDAQLIISGGSTSKRELELVMLGEQAIARIAGAYLLTDDQRVEISCMQRHVAGHNESHVLLKGALAGAAHASYQGTIIVGKEATESNASQENKNMLLSTQARAVSVPNLEALTNDIQCAHGSAVGQLDAEQLMYVQSRGIPVERAKKLLLMGFFGTISSGLDWEKMVERLL